MHGNSNIKVLAATRWFMIYNNQTVSVVKLAILFNVLLTVHHAMILGNCPTWRTNFFQYIYLFIVLYMFRACHAHHQEKQIVSIKLTINVTPCWWQCRVHTTLPPTRSDIYQKLYWYNLFLLMMSMTCSKHVENYK